MSVDEMEEHAYSTSALAQPASNCTSVIDRSTLLAVDASEADEQIGENRAGTLGKTAWGFQKIAWIGGAFFIGTVVGALVFGWSSAANSPGPRSVNKQVALNIGPTPTSTVAEPNPEDHALLFLKSVRSGFYLHVSAKSMGNGGPVFNRDSTTDGSKWQVEFVENSSSIIMLKSVRNHQYLHVPSQSISNGNQVAHVSSTSDGSQWQIEHVGSSGQIIMLKSVRSGLYLHVPSVCDESVFHTDSVSDGSKWLLEYQATPSPTPSPTPKPTDGPNPQDCALLFLKSVRSGFYLHASARASHDGDPLLHVFSRTAGSQWQIERVENSSSVILLKNVRNSNYLHVSSQSMSAGDRVIQRYSVSDGSQWQVEHVGSSGRIIMLKSVRSGFYLHVSSVADELVFHADSASDGSKWLLEEAR